MNDLRTIQKINSLPGVAKLRARALAMNSNEGHQKKRTSVAERLKGTPVGACPALDKLR